jgi:hypothetical protein
VSADDPVLLGTLALRVGVHLGVHRLLDQILDLGDADIIE